MLKVMTCGAAHGDGVCRCPVQDDSGRNEDVDGVGGSHRTVSSNRVRGDADGEKPPSAITVAKVTSEIAQLRRNSVGWAV
jgi:hypothetical protein